MIFEVEIEIESKRGLDYFYAMTRRCQILLRA